jgi:glucan 1,3-beta-glucosidase
MRLPLGLFALSALAIGGTWWWLGLPVQMPPPPLGSERKFDCVSYAPFRGGQSPLVQGTEITEQQIDEDFQRLAPLTGCVRTYSVDFGLHHAPALARKHGLKLILGIWQSGEREKNRYQVETGIRLAKDYADVIVTVIVGNEVLLRGEMSAARLADTIREVKAQVPVPVSYADVWEFWLRHRDLAAVVDRVTIHILPYWEDFPISATHAAAHVDAIYKRVAAAFPGKEVFLGEVGWPSAGRMREGALPSPANQARVAHDVLAAAKRSGYRVNLIEAFDQPWKRQLEGTVGGHWGLLDGSSRETKFAWGGQVSDHPIWQWQAAGGVLFAGLVFVAAGLARRAAVLSSRRRWIGVALMAVVSGVVVGWAIPKVPLESFGIGGWMRSLALAAVALAGPPAAAAALSAGLTMPALSRLVGPRQTRLHDRLAIAAGSLFAATCVLGIQVALGLAFDPRYRDFPFAPLTAAAVPFLILAFLFPQPKGHRPIAEMTLAATLMMASFYVLLTETFANWQSLWLCAALGALALTLLRVRDAPG